MDPSVRGKSLLLPLNMKNILGGGRCYLHPLISFFGWFATYVAVGMSFRTDAAMVAHKTQKGSPQPWQAPPTSRKRLQTKRRWDIPLSAALTYSDQWVVWYTKNRPEPPRETEVENIYPRGNEKGSRGYRVLVE